MRQEGCQDRHGAATISPQDADNRIKRIARREQSLKRGIHVELHTDQRSLAFVR
jgi:hypothetical protein